MNHYRYHLIPVFSDNYIFIVENSKTGRCIVVDPGAAPEVLDFLGARGLAVEAVLITHHHWDHIDGLKKLLEAVEGQSLSVAVYAPEKNLKDIPHVTHYVRGGDRLFVAGLQFSVLDLPGHTLGHVGYFAEGLSWLFSGDVLFGLGCGRLFEGTFEQQYESLEKIKKLPPDTKVFCTHEYTERNLAFCKEVLLKAHKFTDIEALNEYEQNLLKLRSQNEPSVPLKLSSELKCNPFLLAKDVSEFSEIRRMRNNF